MITDMIKMPKALEKFPRDKRGYVIFYCALVDPDTKEPDFRALNRDRVRLCLQHRLCGICGEKIGHYVCFIGGEKSIANRAFSDPPMHYECARYATQVCPYLLGQVIKHTPSTKIRHPSLFLINDSEADNDMRRPAKMAIYRTIDYRACDTGTGFLHCLAGKPSKIEWF